MEYGLAGYAFFARILASSNLKKTHISAKRSTTPSARSITYFSPGQPDKSVAVPRPQIHLAPEMHVVIAPEPRLVWIPYPEQSRVTPTTLLVANGHSLSSFRLWVFPDSTLQGLEIVVLNGRHLIVLHAAVVPEHCSGQTPANMPSEHSVPQDVYAEGNSHSVVL